MPPDRFTLRGKLISVNRGSAELVLVRLQHLEIRVAHDPSVALLGAQENRRRPGHPINPVLHRVTRLVRWRMPRALVGDQVRRVEAVPQRRSQSDLAAVNNWRRSLSPELQNGVISYTEPRKGNRSTVCRRRSWIATHRTTLRREYEGAGEVRCRALPRRVTSPDPTWALAAHRIHQLRLQVPPASPVYFSRCSSQWRFTSSIQRSYQYHVPLTFTP